MTKNGNRKGEKNTAKQKMTIRMISTIQWSVFTIANPMPVCFEKGGVGKKQIQQSEQINIKMNQMKTK